MPHSDYGSPYETNDVWGWTDSDDGTEYVLAGRDDGVSFIDISDPLNPVYVGWLRGEYSTSSWRDIKVYADHAFVVVDGRENNGMQVFDLTALGKVADADMPKEFSSDAVYWGISEAHNVVINEDTGFAYVVGSYKGGGDCNNGLHAVDISSPTSPSYAGCFADSTSGRWGDGYIHDAQCVVYNGPDTDYSDDEVCFTVNETHLGIVDVSDKSDIKGLAIADYPNVGYAHQGWLTEDHSYFLINDEFDEVVMNLSGARTIIWDVTDLEDPVVHGYHYSGAASIDHNLYIRDNLAYMANYTAGLAVVDVGNPGSTSEIATFDTEPDNDDFAYAGVWSVYPFFESEVIAVQSIESGLFLLDLVSYSLVLSADVDTVGEGDGATTITVTATRTDDPYGSDQTIAIAVAGSGTSGTVGFAEVPNFSLTLESDTNAVSGTFTLTPTDNVANDNDETITISSTHADVVNTLTVILEDDDTGGQKPVALSVSPTLLSESDGATTFTVTGTVSGGGTALNALSLPISVAGSGTSGTVGFAAVDDFNVSIASGGTSGTATFTLTPTANLLYEYDETITISSTNSVVSGTATISLTDDDVPAIALSVSPDSIYENDGDTTITVTATVSGNAPASALSLPIAVDASGQSGVVDFTDVDDFSISLASGATKATGTFTLSPGVDTADETDETIYVSSTHAGIPDSATVTIVDDDDAPSGIDLVVSPDTVTEDGGAAVVTLSAAVQGGTTYGEASSLPISVAGSGTSGVVDFSPVSDFTLSVPSGSSSAETTFTLTPTDDSDIEGDETITISSTSALVSGSVTLTITNDDLAAQTVALSVSPTTLSEGDGATTFTVTGTVGGGETANSAFSLPITVTGSGDSGVVDFAAVQGFNLAIASGATKGTATFVLTPTADSDYEYDETITVGSTDAMVTRTATISLTDDDAPAIALSVSPDSISENSGATTITVTAKVSGNAPATAQSVPIAVDGSGQEGAVDFTDVDDFTITLAAGSSEATGSFTLTPTDDAIDETNETVYVSSTHAGIPDSAVVSIADDDDAPNGIDLVVTPDSVDEGDGTTTVTLSAAVLGSTTYGTTASLPISIEGSGGTDVVSFTPISDFTLNVPGGDNSAATTFELTPTDNSNPDFDETVTISSTSALVTGSITLTITNDDDPPQTVVLSVSPTTLGEGDGATTFTLTGTVGGGESARENLPLPITVSGSGASGVVGFGAVADFNLSVASGATSGSATFTLTPTDDLVDEGQETISLSSSSPLTSAAATITLTDDDDAPSGIAIAVTPDSVQEGDGATTITLSATVLGGTTYGSGTALPISVKGSGASGVVGFTPVSDFTLTVPSGSSSAQSTFTLTPTDNSTADSDETVTIGSTSGLVNGSATVTITNDDLPAQSIALSVSPTSLGEGDGNTTFTVTGILASGLEALTDLTLPMAVSGSGNAGVVGFAAVPDFNLSIATEGTQGSATFVLTPTDNEIDETDETVTISSTSDLISGAVTISLTDDDAGSSPSIALSVSPDSISENGGDATITVTATVAGEPLVSAQDLPIAISGSGVEGAVDFAEVDGFTISMASGSNSAARTFQLSPVDDVSDETDETITVSSTHPGVTASAVITVQDDDAAPDGIALSVQPDSLGEGDGTTEITLSASVVGNTTYGTDLELLIAIQGSGTSDVVGFTPVSDFTLTLPDGETGTETTFDLSPVDDEVGTGGEIVTIYSTSPLVLSSAAISITDNDGGQAVITLGASESTLSEGASETEVTVTATVTSGGVYSTAQDIPITVQGSGSEGAVGFTAVPAFTLSLAPGDTEATGTFRLIPEDDTVDEVDETITISSTHPAAGTPVRILLTDNDATPGGIALSVSPAMLAEGDGPTTVTITGSVQGTTTYGLAQALPITVTGSGNADAVDFAPVAGFDLAVGAGTATGTATFTLDPIDDQEAESAEVITISSTSALALGAALITLTDNDGGQVPGIYLLAHPSVVDESVGDTTITVTASVLGPTYGDALTLPIAVRASGIEGAVDFAEVTEFDLALASGASSATATFAVSPADDLVDELDERIAVTSMHALVRDTAYVTLVDNDDAPDGVRLFATPSTVGEGDGPTQITVRGEVAGATRYGVRQEFPIRISGSGDEAAVDFAPVGDFALSIAPEADGGSTVFVLTPIDDQEQETSETITIGSVHAAILSSAEIVLTDNDGATSTEPEAARSGLRIAPPYPNPASGVVSFIVEAQSHAEHVSLRLFNVLGQRVATLYEGALQSGKYTFQFVGDHLPPGAYIYVLESPKNRQTGRLVVTG